MLKLIAETSQNLKQFTDEHYAQASFFWTYLLKNKEIRVNGQRVQTDVKLQAGDEVSYYLTPKQEQKPAFYTVYEDAQIHIIDKESGVNAEAVFAALSRTGEYYFIHRIDRNTMGLMVFAKTRTAEQELLAAFKARQVQKTYHALCFGTFPKPADTLTAYLKKDGARASVSVFDTPQKGAEKIVTEYHVLESAQYASQTTTKAEIILHTGKTHQIRAHTAHIGCPIVGDMKYGDNAKNKAVKCSRQCLVAKRISFAFSGELAYLNGKVWRSQFQAELPPLSSL